jgi:subtilase family serine protease
LQTQINRYRANGSEHLANATEVSLPAAVANVTLSVGNLSGFRPRPRLRLKAHYTNSSDGDHYLAPDDFTTIYDVKPLYNAGYTGSGQTIAIVGQSEILASDVADFRSAAGLTVNAPTFTLVPNSGTAAISSGDEEESDLDVEWSGAIAQAATINFVYVGNNQNYSVFDSLQYAVDNNLAPVISTSYGACESSFDSTDVSSLTTIFEQANAQGQTIIAASGDDGAADCDDSSTTTITSATHGLAVDLPASSPYVTGVGGTEFLGDVASPGSYWTTANNSSGGSAISYIPEEAWNDSDETTPSNGLAASGGGKSTLFGKPSWQTGTSVPADGARDVPDIALDASPQHDGLIFCNEGSCSSGFAGAITKNTIAGGTSFGAPNFSGILTLANQKAGSNGQGNLNPVLYALAASTPSVYHDVTTGNNEVPCTSGSPDCGSSGVLGYAAGPGYDQVTGWGSIDANAFATAVAASATSGLVSTTTVITASPASPTIGTSITFTATVTPSTGSTAPTGTIQFAVGGAAAGNPVTLTASGSSSTATYTTSFTTSGTYTITAAYSGDSTNAASTGTLSETVAAVAQSFSITATNVTISQGSSGTSTVTVTPGGGYTGTVAFTISGPSTLANTCYTLGSASITSNAAVSATLTINTTAAACTTAGARHLTVASLSGRSGSPASGSPLGTRLAIALALFPFAAFAGFRRRQWQGKFLALCFAAAMLAALTGCGGGSSTQAQEAAKGTYTLTITGTDSSANISNSTTMTLTID